MGFKPFEYGDSVCLAKVSGDDESG